MKQLLLAALVAYACTNHASNDPASAGPSADPTAVRPTPDSTLARGGDTLGLDSLPTWWPADPAARRALLTGRFDPARDSNFVVVPPRITDGDGPYWLRRETASAIERLIDSARASGLDFRVVSATRNFDRQAAIWGAKWRGERTLSNGVNLGTTHLSDSAKARMILLYSSMPGTSRHHWGTDLDLNDLDPAYWRHGRGAREYAWLQANAARFGFFQPYTTKAQGRTGYEEEHWHWSYAPLSVPLLARYGAEVDYKDIAGFDGSATAATVRAIEDYVFGIGPAGEAVGAPGRWAH